MLKRLRNFFKKEKQRKYALETEYEIKTFLKSKFSKDFSSPKLLDSVSVLSLSYGISKEKMLRLMQDTAKEIKDISRTEIKTKSSGFIGFFKKLNPFSQKQTKAKEAYSSEHFLSRLLIKISFSDYAKIKTEEKEISRLNRIQKQTNNARIYPSVFSKTEKIISLTKKDRDIVWSSVSFAKDAIFIELENYFKDKNPEYFRRLQSQPLFENFLNSAAILIYYKGISTLQVINSFKKIPQKDIPRTEPSLARVLEDISNF